MATPRLYTRSLYPPRRSPGGRLRPSAGTAKNPEQVATSQLRPKEIENYVASLKSSAIHWFTSFFPELYTELSFDEQECITQLNRIGIGYFRPLVMAVLKKRCAPSERVRLFRSIERFIFLSFRLSWAQANYRSSEFQRAAKDLDAGGTIQAILNQLDQALAGRFLDDGNLSIASFHAFMTRKFNSGAGYYGWSGLRYFLYEYELSLLSDSRQRKVAWADLLVSKKDTISVEHIYPQTETTAWQASFAGLVEKDRGAYGGSLGNLLLLSRSINSSLQNDAFEDKKSPRFNDKGDKTRNGYADGSHSEIEVARENEWTPVKIRSRGLRMLTFMERRWDIRLRDEDREALLFLPTPISK